MRSAAWFLGCLCLVGCSSAAGSPSISGSIASVTSTRPVIGALETRDRMIMLFASPDGLRVTVRDGSGAVLAKEITIEQLRDQDTVLYELCRSAVASNGTYLDARVDLPEGR
jgi:hypothetical protein